MSFAFHALGLRGFQDGQEKLFVEITGRENNGVREEIVDAIEQITTIHRLIGGFSEILRRKILSRDETETDVPVC